MEYSDSAPWPTEADGKGSFLEIIDINSDNSVASGWKTSNTISGVNHILFEKSICIYPTPARKTITVTGNNFSVRSYIITDMLGRVISTNNNLTTSSINIEDMKPNVYFIELHFENGATVMKKFLKE